MGLHNPRVRPFPSNVPTNTASDPASNTTPNSEVPKPAINASGDSYHHMPPMFSQHASAAVFFSTTRTPSGKSIDSSPFDASNPELQTTSFQRSTSGFFSQNNGTNTSGFFMQHNNTSTSFGPQTNQNKSYSQSRTQSMESIVFESKSGSGAAAAAAVSSSPYGSLNFKNPGRLRQMRVIRISSVDVLITEFTDEGGPDVAYNPLAMVFPQTAARAPECRERVEQRSAGASWPTFGIFAPDTDIQGVVGIGSGFGRKGRGSRDDRMSWEAEPIRSMRGSDSVDVMDVDLMDVDGGTGLGCSKWRS